MSSHDVTGCVMASAEISGHLWTLSAGSTTHFKCDTCLGHLNPAPCALTSGLTTSRFMELRLAHQSTHNQTFECNQSPNHSVVCFRLPRVSYLALNTMHGLYKTRAMPRVWIDLRAVESAHLMMVRGLLNSSKRIEYPTCSPNMTSISSATRRATDIAATRRGCVHATILPCCFAPVSSINCGICVVLPDPVSPTRMVVWCSCTILMKSPLACHTGSPARLPVCETEQHHAGKCPVRVLRGTAPMDYHGQELWA